MRVLLVADTPPKREAALSPLLKVRSRNEGEELFDLGRSQPLLDHVAGDFYSDTFTWNGRRSPTVRGLQRNLYSFSPFRQKAKSGLSRAFADGSSQRFWLLVVTSHHPRFPSRTSNGSLNGQNGVSLSHAPFRQVAAWNWPAGLCRSVWAGERGGRHGCGGASFPELRPRLHRDEPGAEARHFHKGAYPRNQCRLGWGRD